jgi:hypothetical protein
MRKELDIYPGDYKLEPESGPDKLNITLARSINPVVEGNCLIASKLTFLF